MTFGEKILMRFGLTKADKVKEAFRVGRIRGRREYAGAAVNRLTSDWISSVTSIQQDVRANFVTLRERARDLAKNNPLVRRWLRLCEANIVGPHGFTLQSNVFELVEDPADRKTKRQPDKVANMKIEEAFQEWTKPANCSVNGRLSFRQICRQLVAYKKRDGEAILYKVRNRSRFGLQVHVIAPETLDETKNETLSNGNVILMGIELDKWRRPVNYYFRKTDPYLELYGNIGYTNEHIVIPASKIIHYFHREFENQTRGVTELSPVMIMLRHIQGYDEAAVINARGAATRGILYETSSESPHKFEGDDEDADGNIIDALEPGEDKQLPPGVKPYLVDPKYPSEQYESFKKTTGKELSAGMGVAFASLTNDLSEGSYGSNRVGLLDERSQWQMEQQDFIDNVLSELYPDWLEMALLKVINLPFEKLEKFNRPHWVGRTWDWIDPEKDVAAHAIALSMGLESPWKIIGERGGDPEEILQELSEWYAMAKKKGVPLKLGDISININGSSEPKSGKNGKKGDEEDERDILAIVNNNGRH